MAPYLTYAVGEIFEDISSFVSRVMWSEDPDPASSYVTMMVIVFNGSAEALAAQAALMDIERSISFIYGPAGRVPGAEKIRGEVRIRPGNSRTIVVACGMRRIERSRFGEWCAHE